MISTQQHFCLKVSGISLKSINVLLTVYTAIMKPCLALALVLVLSLLFEMLICRTTAVSVALSCGAFKLGRTDKLCVGYAVSITTTSQRQQKKFLRSLCQGNFASTVF